MINIVLALDEKYWHKANEYKVFDSIKYNTHNAFVKCLCIGFDIPKNDVNFKAGNWMWSRCEIEDLNSFRKGWPKDQKNRPYFVCAEGGEFWDYFHFNADDVIIHIDADVIMQRPFYEHELLLLQNLRYGEVGGTYHSMPSFSLETESKSLRMNETIEQAKKHFPNHWEKPIFCTGVVVATAQTYRDIIYKHYLPLVDKMTMLFNHHAAGQWLMCQVVYEHANFINLGHIFHHANWFIGSDKKDVANDKLCYKGSTVLFNHHKFELDRVWNFQ